MKIEIGKTYETEYGDQVEITRNGINRGYPFIGVVVKGDTFLEKGSTEEYTEDGRWLLFKKTMRADLIKEIPDKEQFEREIKSKSIEQLLPGTNFKGPDK